MFVVDSPRLGTIRLYSNGSTLPTLSAGIVQIYYRSHSSNTLEWGNICDNKSPDDDLSFDENEANVICNQLGYSGALDFGRADTNTRYCIIEVVVVVGNFTVTYCKAVTQSLAN